MWVSNELHFQKLLQPRAQVPQQSLEPGKELPEALPALLAEKFSFEYSREQLCWSDRKRMNVLPATLRSFKSRKYSVILWWLFLRMSPITLPSMRASVLCLC